MSKNYSETLAYWYLRLNGFFPLNDFVLHWTPEQRLPQPEGEPERTNNMLREGEGSADCDILCVRFPFVYETIGGNSEEDWDDLLRTKLRILEQRVALIVQVKDAKTCQASGVKEAFSEWRIKYALNRLGIFRQDTESGKEAFKDAVTALVDDNTKMHFDATSEFCIAKMSITRKSCPNSGWLNITLGEALGFLQWRLRKYAPNKQGSWIHFPDDLLQYLIWAPTLETGERGSMAARTRLESGT